MLDFCKLNVNIDISECKTINVSTYNMKLLLSDWWWWWWWCCEAWNCKTVTLKCRLEIEWIYLVTNQYGSFRALATTGSGIYLGRQLLWLRDKSFGGRKPCYRSRASESPGGLPKRQWWNADILHSLIEGNPNWIAQPPFEAQKLRRLYDYEHGCLVWTRHTIHHESNYHHSIPIFPSRWLLFAHRAYWDPRTSNLLTVVWKSTKQYWKTDRWSFHWRLMSSLR